MGQSVSSRCCTPVVSVPLLPPVVENLIVADGTTTTMSLIHIAASVRPVLEPTDLSGRSAHLPIPDLLIAHQVFLI